MTKRRFDIPQPVELEVIHCGGPLTVRGWDRPAIEVEAEGTEEELRATLEDTTLTVEAQRSCSIRCPRNTTAKLGRIDGHLSISSLDRSISLDACCGPALLRSISAAASLDRVDGGLRVYSLGGSLRVDRIGGNASLKSIEGTATIGSVGGTLRSQRLQEDLVVRSVAGGLRAQSIVGSLRAEEVRGSLRAQGVGGDLNLKTVSGNGRVRDLGGPLTLREVGGNLRASILGAGMVVGRVGGNLHLEGPLTPGQSYQGEAGGNITLRLPVSASARLELRAGGRVRTDLPLNIEVQDQGHLVGTVGDGGAHVALKAGGSIRLREWGGPDIEATAWVEELEGLAEQIERQVDEALQDVDFEAIGQEVEARMAQAQQRLDSVDWERLGREAQKAAEAGIAQAQEAIQRVLTRMEAWRDEHVADQPTESEVRTEVASQAVDVAPAEEEHPYPSPITAGEATDEERMAILRMVERGQITPDEGDMLLDALEE